MFNSHDPFTKMKKKTKIEYKKTDNQSRDYQKFYMVKPDPDFSPERNKWVVEHSMQEAAKIARKKHKDYMDKLAERAEAAASYAMYLESHGDTPADKYFGRKILGQLHGRKLRQELIDKAKGIYSIESLDDEIFTL